MSKSFVVMLRVGLVIMLSGVMSSGLRGEWISGTKGWNPVGDTLSTTARVGIGTTSPGGKLDVHGKIKEYGNDLLPSGVIVMWSGTLAAIPSGWSLCDGTSGTPDLRDKFIYGVSTAENPGATGGSTSHTHSYSCIPSHSHSASCSMDGSHSHTVSKSDGPPGAGTWGNPVSNVTDSYTNQAWVANLISSNGDHSHTITIGATGSSSCSTDGGSSLPPYYKLAFIMKD